MATVWVAGWCQRRDCRAPFVVRHDSGNTVGWPATCSKRCRKQETIRRHAAREQTHADAERRRADAERRSAAVTRARVRCRGCWLWPPTPGEVLCRFCRSSVAACCQGKMRFAGQETASVRAASRSHTIGEDLGAYQCPVCDWWHMGHRVGTQVEKRIRFLAALFVDTLSPDELVLLQQEWAPNRVGPIMQVSLRR